MLRVDEGAYAAHLLGLGHAVQGHGGFTAAFRPVNFYHAAPGQTAHTQRHIQLQTAGGDHLQIRVRRRVAEFHDRALAVGLVQLGQSAFQRFHFFFPKITLFAGDLFFGRILFRSHALFPLMYLSRMIVCYLECRTSSASRSAVSTVWRRTLCRSPSK